MKLRKGNEFIELVHEAQIYVYKRDGWEEVADVVPDSADVVPKEKAPEEKAPEEKAPEEKAKPAGAKK